MSWNKRNNRNNMHGAKIKEVTYSLLTDTRIAGSVFFQLLDNAVFNLLAPEFYI